MPNALLNGMNAAASSPGTNMSPGSGPPVPGAPPAAPGGPAGPGAGGPAAPQKTATLDQVKGAIRKQSEIAHRLGSLLESGKPVERKDAIDACVGLVADRIFTAEEMAGYLTDMPQDPMQVRDWLSKHEQNADQNLDKLIAMVHGQDAPPAEPMMPEAGMPNGGRMA